jgi:hypothetical protein
MYDRRHNRYGGPGRALIVGACGSGSGAGGPDGPADVVLVTVLPSSGSDGGGPEAPVDVVPVTVIPSSGSGGGGREGPVGVVPVTVIPSGVSRGCFAVSPLLCSHPEPTTAPLSTTTAAVTTRLTRQYVDTLSSYQPLVVRRGYVGRRPASPPQPAHVSLQRTRCSPARPGSGRRRPW